MIKIYYSFLLVLLGIYGLKSQNQCATINNNLWQNTWQSCETNSNPNTARGNGHWIMYDLGAVYDLSSTWIWNVNDPSELNTGFKDVIVDYSINNSTWTTLGTYTFEKGTGASDYQGFSGPDFAKNKARYVLFSSTENWGDVSCHGITEVRFNLTEPSQDPELATIIPPTLYALEATSDGSGNVHKDNVKSLYLQNESVTITATPNTGFHFSHWTGDNIGNQNPLTIIIYRHINLVAHFTTDAVPHCQSEEISNQGILPSGEYVASKSVISSGTVISGRDILFLAGQDIELVSSFEVQLGGVFTADIEECVE